MSLDLEGRYGKFSIDKKVIDSSDDLVMQIMGMCVILRAEFNYYKKAIDYIALSPHFEPIEMGTLIPEYNIIIHADEDSFDIKFVKIERK